MTSPLVPRAATEALRLVSADPDRARELAVAAREQARMDRDPASASTAERALGLAARELNELPAAVAHLRAAVRIADRAGLVVGAAEARMTLALVLAARGDTRGALRATARAGAVLRGVEAARLQTQLALILQRAGHFDAALDGYRRALAVFRREGDQLWEARLRNNRGVLAAYRGQTRAAAADLELAERLHIRLGQDLAAADTRWNRGFAAMRAGALAEALGHYAVADEYYRTHRIPRAALLSDRCEVLLASGLFREARAAAEQAVAELSRRRMHSDLAEARLMLAQAALAAAGAAGAADTADTAGAAGAASALAAARLAAQAFTAQDRPAWAALARYTAVRACWQAGRRTRAGLRAAVDSAGELAAAGWTVPAMDARIIAARIAMDLGQLDTAGRELRQASRARRDGPVALRTRAWLAEALLRRAAGDTRGAFAALRTGLRAIDRHRLTLGATELRVHASAHAADLAGLGLDLAVRAARPAQVLAWAERCRAQALLLPPVRPAGESVLAAELAELRAVTAEREQALLAGTDPSRADQQRLRRRQAALERSIQDLSRRTGATPARSDPGPGSVPSIAALTWALGERALVEFVEHAGQLLAVVVAAGRGTAHRLGPAAAAASAFAALRFALRRLGSGLGPPAARASARQAVAFDAAHLDGLLLTPFRARLTDRELVIVPTGALHGVPWAALPTCAGRPLTVAPSARLWLRGAPAAAATPAAAAAPGARVVLVAGPDLPAAGAEVESLAGRYPEAIRLAGEAARVEVVMGALDGAACAHIAAHGRYRADNALFSALLLADGPLTVYDLETLRRAPDLVVLSACDSGVTSVHSGDELVGLASALLAMGTRALIAALTPVPDAATGPLMLAVHDALRAGTPPAVALARAQAGLVADARGGAHEDLAVAAATAFVCFGSR